MDRDLGRIESMPAKADIPVKNPLSGPEAMPVTTRVLSLDLPPEGFRLVSGKTLKVLEVAYETYGTLNASKSNAVMICSPLTTDAHAAGYNPDYERAKDRIGWWD